MATLCVDKGLEMYNNRLKGTGTEPFYIAWGTGAGTTAVTDTTLFTESAQESRTAGTSSITTTSSTNDTYQVTGAIVCQTATKTITNAGLFDASTSGNLFMKSDFAGISVDPGETIDFTFTVVLAN